MRGKVDMGLFLPRKLSAFAHSTLYLKNIVGGLALGRFWKGDSSPSFLKKCFPAVPGGAGRVLAPHDLASLSYSWPTIPRMPPLHLP